MKMSLAEKGTIAPPPVLRTPYQSTAAEIASWEAVIAATHWYIFDADRVDGADFYVGEAELGHIHLTGTVHLATNKALCHALIQTKAAHTFPFGGSYRHWVEYDIESPEGAEHATWLFRLNYDRLRGAPIADLLRRIHQRHATP